MPEHKLPEFFINAFYESKFRDNLFIVKAGGRIIQNEKALEALMRNIQSLTLSGIDIILVYGFGNAMNTAAEDRGIGLTKHNGHRVTDAATIGLIEEVVCGGLSMRVNSAMAKTQTEGLNLNALPHNWLDLSLWDKNEKGQDFGFVANIDGVHPRPIMRLLKSNDFLVTPCIGTMDNGQHVNMNADRIAMNLAVSLQADKLIFLSDVDGVLDKDGNTINLITEKDLPDLIKGDVVSGGMRIKIEQSFEALNKGIKRIHLINGFREDALYKEIFESVGPGTMLLREDERENYMNEVEVHKVIGGSS